MGFDKKLYTTIPKPELNGCLNITITFLQMTQPPKHFIKPPKFSDLAVLRARNPTVAFYRYLYNRVGEPWLWYERRAMSDKTLIDILKNQKIQVYVLYRDGEPAGYAELDRRITDEVEIAYFGLMPENIGDGIGPWFLGWTLETAWSEKPKRVIVNTCNLDHPKAIITYQRAGFKPYKQEKHTIIDPRRTSFWF